MITNQSGEYMVNLYNTLWWKKYVQLVEFIYDNNRFPKSCKGSKIEASLYTWVSRQRINYEFGLISQEKAAHLNNIPDWNWKKVRDRKI
ncbi:MAG: helicase associated domain-containing protein [Paraclostridium sp.]